MYGLPQDLDLSFFVGKTLIQLSIGQFIISFAFQGDEAQDLDQRVSLNVESSMRLHQPDGTTAVIGRLDYRQEAGVLLPLISHDVQSASPTPSGALRLEWSNGAALDADDDSDQYESYTITHGDRLFVV